MKWRRGHSIQNHKLLPNITPSDIDPNGVVVLLFSCTVLSTLLKPEPIAEAEDSSSGSASCTIAVNAVKMGEDIMAADSGQGSVMQGDGRRASAETGGMNRPLVNEFHCTYTFPLRGAVIATTRKNRHTGTILGCPLSIACICSCSTYTCCR